MESVGRTEFVVVAAFMLSVVLVPYAVAGEPESDSFRMPEYADHGLAFRVLLLRGIAWAGRRDVDRFNDLVTLDARVK